MGAELDELLELLEDIELETEELELTEELE